MHGNVWNGVRIGTNGTLASQLLTRKGLSQALPACFAVAHGAAPVSPAVLLAVTMHPMLPATTATGFAFP